MFRIIKIAAIGMLFSSVAFADADDWGHRHHHRHHSHGFNTYYRPYAPPVGYYPAPIQYYAPPAPVIYYGYPFPMPRHEHHHRNRW